MSLNTDFSTQLEIIRAKYGLPSLSAAVIFKGQLVDVAAVGFRATNKPEQVTLADAYQLGSITKGFTATMIARLVEQGILSFDMTLGKAPPDVVMQPDYKAVTLKLLLTHRSGIQANVRPPFGAVQFTRTNYLETALKKPRGQQKFLYSNVGYVAAAMIAEGITGKTWEDLIRQEVFVPHEMEGCGFGYGTINDPAPHLWLLPFWKKYQILPMSYDSGNSSVIFGAGGIRCPLIALIKYALAHLYHSSFLRPETWKYLHHDPYGSSEYAFGWTFGAARTSPGALGHDGSDGLNYARIVISPMEDMAVVVATNVGMSILGFSSNRTMRAMTDTTQAVKKMCQNLHRDFGLACGQELFDGLLTLETLTTGEGLPLPVHLQNVAPRGTSENSGNHLCSSGQGFEGLAIFTKSKRVRFGQTRTLDGTLPGLCSD